MAESRKQLTEYLGRLIERRQKHVPIEPHQIAELEAELEEALSQGMRDVISNIEPATPFEDPISSFLLSEWRQRVEPAIASLSFPLARWPVIGTLPTDRVNAMAVSVPSSDEYLVIFHSQLLPFIGLIARVCSKVTPFTLSDEGIVASFAKDHIRTSIEQNPRGVRAFQELLEACLITGRPSAVGPDLELTREQTVFSGSLFYCIGTFILGHEYAHIFANHLSSAARSPVVIGGQTEEEVLWSWRAEDEADTYGVLIMLRAMSSQDLWLRFWGPKLFLSCTSVLENALSILRTGKESKPRLTATHPPTELRHNHIGQLMVTYLKTNLESLGTNNRETVIHAAKETETVMDAAEALDEIMKALWESAKPRLHQLYQSGKRPAAIWGL